MTFTKSDVIWKTIWIRMVTKIICSGSGIVDMYYQDIDWLIWSMIGYSVKKNSFLCFSLYEIVFLMAVSLNMGAPEIFTSE